MKRLLFLSLLGMFVLSFSCFSQNKGVSFSAFTVSAKAQLDDLDSVDVTLEFVVQNFENLKFAHLSYGSISGSGEILAADFTYENKSGVHFLRYGDLFYPIQNGKVKLEGTTSKSYFKGKTYLKVNATDKSGSKNDFVDEKNSMF